MLALFMGSELKMSVALTSSVDESTMQGHDERTLPSYSTRSYGTYSPGASSEE